MAEKIEKWRAKDGKEFDTEAEAITHEAIEDFASTCIHISWSRPLATGLTEYSHVAIGLIEARHYVENFYKALPKEDE